MDDLFDEFNFGRFGGPEMRDSQTYSADELLDMLPSLGGEKEDDSYNPEWDSDGEIPRPTVKNEVVEKHEEVSQEPIEFKMEDRIHDKGNKKTNFAPQSSAVAIKEKYKSVVEFRSNHDFMWGFIFADNNEFRKDYLKPIPRIMAEYFNSRDSGKYAIDDKARRILEFAASSNDRIIGDALWYMAIHLLPSVSKWFLDLSKSPVPPMIFNRDSAETFIDNDLERLADDFYERGELTSFVRDCRHAYFLNVGVPM
jgi:hypothetical protein